MKCIKSRQKIKRLKLTTLAVSGLMLAAGGNAVAGGFQIPEMGIKAMGMGNAVTAIADDPSANWYNPAGLAFQGSGITAGGIAVLPTVDFTENASNPSPGTTSSSINKKTIGVPHAYLNVASESDLSFGFGVNAPFGLEIAWPTTAVFSGFTQYARLQAVNVNGNVAYKINDAFAIAAGVDYVNMYKVDFNGTVLKQNFKGDGWGYNIAALYKTDVVNVGVSYRSSVKIKSNGNSTLGPVTVANTITVKMPDILSIGTAFHPTESLTLSVDADWVNWKKFDQLAFTYSSALPGVGSSLTVKEKWKSTWAFRVGAEWAYTNTMRARFGYTYDPTPITSPDFTPLIPGNDRQAVHLGYGVDVSDAATIDLAYMYVWLSDRNQTQSTGTSIVRNGVYKSSIHLFGASMTYTF